MAATQTPLPVASLQPLNWMEVGEPPSAIDEWRAARLRKLGPVTSALMGVFIAGIAGYAGVLLWPGALTWSFEGKAELFLATALPVGIVEFFAMLWLLAWVAKASELHVRRVATSEGKLHVEMLTGRSNEWPLTRVGVSNDPVAGGWHSVMMAAGRASVVFYVPPLVAASIRSASGQ
jgi:hypothetical protein